MKLFFLTRLEKKSQPAAQNIAPCEAHPNPLLSPRQLARPANRGAFLIPFFLFLILPHGLAYTPETDDPKLEELGKNYLTVTSEYRTALKAKKDFVSGELKQTEDSLAAEDNKEKRVKLVERLRDLKNQYDDLSDKLRVISAGEVVKFSNTKDKVVAFLTHQ